MLKQSWNEEIFNVKHYIILFYKFNIHKTGIILILLCDKSD